jgi:predicted nucleic acid-binding protein
VAAFFFDTSALVKRHVTEVGSSWVRSQTAARAGHTLYIAGITAVEMTSAITRRQRGGSLSAAQGGAIYGHFRRHLAQRYIVLEITPPLMAAAMLLARSHGLRAYDAVQLSAALDIQRGHRHAGLAPITLVSADQALNDAAAVEGLPVEDPPPPSLNTSGHFHRFGCRQRRHVG